MVVDTNVLLSAALSPLGTAAQLLDHLLRDGALLFSTATFEEFQTRLWKPKFDRYLSMETRRALLRDLDASAFWVEIPAAIAAQKFSRDPADDAFVHTALAAQANRIVSGDDDLLCLHPLGEIQILTPRAALAEILGQL